MITVSYYTDGRKKIPMYSRKFNFIVNHKKELYNSPVVYIIFMGDKFYIGEAIKYMQRVNSHTSKINSLSWNPAIKTEVTYIHSIANIRDHLMANPDIEDIIFDVLEECPVDYLLTIEELWFADVCNFGLAEFCLNHHGVHSEKFGYAKHEPYHPKEGIDLIL